MDLKHSVMVPLMGRQADRFHEYQPARDLAERLARAKRVRGIDGIEVVYPSDFVDPEEAISMIRDCGLPVSAVNLNVKSAKKWQPGSFAASDPGLRADAVMFGAVTQFSTHPRLQTGLFLRLLDLRRGVVVWAVDHTWDTTDKQTEARMKRFFDARMRGDYGPADWRMVRMSPLTFQKFIAHEVVATLPAPSDTRRSGP